jgi:hypothetical protein
MTGLHRTELTLAQKVQCAAQAVARQAHGTVTELSQRFGLSRPTGYEVAATAEAVLARHFEHPVGHALCVEVDQAQLERAIVALRVVAPNSIRAIEELLPILYPGMSVSYGRVQQLLIDAQVQAVKFNRQADLSAIRAGALDEVFSQGWPVLAGIDLASGYVFGLRVENDRGGESWAAVLSEAREQGLALEIVVKDAAKGIAAGVEQIFPQAEQRDDCFHAHYEMNRVRHRLERQAYAALEREEELLRQLRTTRLKQAKQRRRLKQKLAWAQRKSAQAIAAYDAFAVAVERAQTALSWVDLQTHQLRTGEQVQADLLQAAAAMRALDREDACHVAHYVANRAAGLACYASELHTALSALAEEYGTEAVALAAVIIQVSDDLHQRRRPWASREQSQHLLGAYHHLGQRLGDRADTLIERVQQQWQHRYRASSAIEGFNASLRPYLYVHKGVTQGFLELYRAYYNLRTRRWGRHHGTSAHQCLSRQRVDDWLTVLGFSPSHAVH